MKKALLSGLALWFALYPTMGCKPAKKVEPVAVSIGSGDLDGASRAAADAVCRAVNRNEAVHGVRCSLETLEGSSANLEGVLGGRIQFGIVTSEDQFQALKGISEWEGRGPQGALRAVVGLQPEALTLVASVKSKVTDIRDLKKKKVLMGEPGSRIRRVAVEALTAVGLDWERDMKALSGSPADGPGWIGEGKIDAFFLLSTHPDEALRQATSAKAKLRIIPITGVDALLEQAPYFGKTTLPAGFYPAAEAPRDILTFGTRATLVTAASVPEAAVYTLTKAIIENLEEIQAAHPALSVLSPKEMPEGLTAPIHPGALKYFKEAGIL